MNCAHCGQELPPGWHGTNCPACGAPIPSDVLHWENRIGKGPLPALMATIRDSLFRPTRLFRAMNPSGPYSWALLYAVIVGTIGALAGLLWHFGLGRLSNELPLMAGAGFVATWVILATPIFVTLGLVVGSAIVHVCLLLVGGATSGYVATFRAIAYSHAAQLWNIIPMCGGLIAFPWTLVLQVIALREFHRTTTGRALAGVLIPVVLCCGAVLILALTAFSALMVHLRGLGGMG